MKQRHVLLIVIVAFLTPSVSAESLSWRPCNTVYNTPDLMGIENNWTEDFDFDDDVLKYCAPQDNSTDMLSTGYLGNATMYLQQNLKEDFLTGEVYRQGSVTFHMSNLSYNQSKSIGHPSDGVRVKFDYYRPKSTKYGCVRNTTQYILIGNDEANFSEGSGTFDDAFYELNYSQMNCGEWQNFDIPIEDFTNDYGSSFSKNSKTIGAFGLEMANMYIKNIRLVGMNKSKKYRIW